MKRDLYAEVSTRIVAELEAGAAPWVKPWSATAGMNTPCNAVTNRPYSGCNVLLLWMAQTAGYRTRRRRLPPSAALLHPAPQNGIAQHQFLGHRPDRAAARSDKIDRLPLIVLRKRSTLTCFHPTPPGSTSQLQVSINSEGVHRNWHETDMPTALRDVRSQGAGSTGRRITPWLKRSNILRKATDG
jgi:N-terminal domain of anti-restriction factor ArdC